MGPDREIAERAVAWFALLRRINANPAHAPALAAEAAQLTGDISPTPVAAFLSEVPKLQALLVDTAAESLDELRNRFTREFMNDRKKAADVAEAMGFVPTLIRAVLDERTHQLSLGWASKLRHRVHHARHREEVKKIEDLKTRIDERKLVEDRRLLMEACDLLKLAIPFDLVHEVEKTEIAAARRQRGQQDASSQLFRGLALSGGGIRSATFNLGVLQGLARARKLSNFDYLSTVSGGGYIGCFLTSWIRRLGDVREVEHRLDPDTALDPAAPEVHPIRWLRRYSNYLTPRTGFFSADTWTLGSVYVRNLLLTLLTILSALATAILVPRVLYLFFEWTPVMQAILVAAVLIVGSFLVISAGLRSHSDPVGDGGIRARLRGLAGFLVLCAAVVTATVVFSSYGWLLALVTFAATLGFVVVASRRLSRTKFAARLSSRGDHDEADTAFWFLVCLLAALVIGPSAWVVWSRWNLTGAIIAGILAAAVAFGTYRLFTWVKNKVDARALPGTRGPNDSVVQRWSIVPILLACFLGALALWSARLEWNPFPFEGVSNPVWLWSLTAGVFVFFSLTLVSVAGGYLECYSDHSTGAHAPWYIRVALVTSYNLLAGVASVLLMRVLLVVLARWSANPEAGDWIAMVVGPVLLLEFFVLSIVLQTGLFGINLPDDRREWWSRVGAWAHIYSAGWLLVSGIAIVGPHLVAKLHALVAAGLSGGWLLASIAGARAAFSSDTGKEARGKKKPSAWREALASVAPYIFVLGLLLHVSFGLNFVLMLLSDRAFGIPSPYADVAALGGPNYWRLLHLHPLLVIAAFIAATGLTLLLARRVDVNEFSIHHLYKNRLVRAYLGASRRRDERAANALTGFDKRDDLKLASFTAAGSSPSYNGPYPIVNCSLNCSSGQDLATQERMSESFVFTPLYSGYEYVMQMADTEHDTQPFGYRPTRHYAYGFDNGIGLGTAMAISGAAANPNMGYHSSPPVAFLLTMFNVRLGWWLGNTRAKHAWRYSSPRLGLMYMLSDLFGTATSSSNYINLSDGGHFDNLGVYELVRRRCKEIVACDSEGDPDYTFNALGNVIRRCRADFGVEIEIDVSGLRPAQDKPSAAHCRQGIIHYPDGSKGMLLYIKASLTGDEPADVVEYSTRAPNFPHQSTADQWFDESQFESYRRLGLHIAREIWQ